MDLHNQGKPSLRMKTIILLILSALTAFAATTYPVLTDNPLRTFSGGGTNLALLNGTNQVFTGTNTFNTNTVLGTNRVGDFLGDGARWRRLHLQTYTNWTPTASTAETNALYSVTLPALMSPNSRVSLTAMVWKTNVSFQAWTLEVRANSTNGPTVNGVSLIGANNYANPGANATGGGFPYVLFSNCGSYTRQIVNGTNYNVTTNVFDLGWDTQQTTNTLHFMLINTSAAGTTPLNIEFIELVERY